MKDIKKVLAPLGAADPLRLPDGTRLVRVPFDPARLYRDADGDLCLRPPDRVLN